MSKDIRNRAEYKDIDELWKLIDVVYEVKLKGYKGKWSIHLERLDHEDKTYCVVFGENKKLGHSFMGIFRLTVRKTPAYVDILILRLLRKAIERDLKGSEK